MPFAWLWLEKRGRLIDENGKIDCFNYYHNDRGSFDCVAGCNGTSANFHCRGVNSCIWRFGLACERNVGWND